MDRRRWLDSQLTLPQPDRRKIWEWAHDAIPELPAAYAIRGRFNVDNSPWLRAPFDSMVDPLVRRTTVAKAIQSGGTLLAEVTSAYRIANDPGPSTFTCQSDEMATKEGKTRMIPLFEAIPQIANILPRPGPHRTQTEVFFPGGLFFIINAANINSQQSQSVRYKVNDEIWMPSWADVYDDACKRVTAFEQQGVSHILDISQGGHEGDWMDWSFKNGSMEEWGATCKHCGESMPLHFRQAIDEETKSWSAGVVWDPSAKRSDGTYDEVRAAETVRFRCVHCGKEESDSNSTRARWRRAGHYLPARQGALRHWKSYHWEAVVAHPLSILATEWCQAENHFHRMGDDTPRKKFLQKREARAWKEEKKSITVTTASDYTVEQYKNGQQVPGEMGRVMVIDRQESHFWVEVGAFTANSYQHLFFDRVDTRDMLRAIQKRYNVANEMVAQDRRYMPSMVDRDCLEFGWRGMMGVSRKTWTMENQETGKLENFPHSDPKFTNTGAIYYEFSSDHCKDVVAAGIKGDSVFKWRLPKDVNPLYLEHLKSEERKEVSPGKMRWVEVRQNANHGLDTSSIMAAILIIAGVYRLILEKE